MQKYHDEPKQYKGYLKSALAASRLDTIRRIASIDLRRFCGMMRSTRHIPEVVMSEPQITHRPLATLTPWARNARTHSKKQIRQIAASIRQFGFTVPVLIDEAGTILAGHGRVAAAILLGLTEVPCLQIEHLSEAQKRAYVLADNKLALNANWDEDLLATELGALLAPDLDLDIWGHRLLDPRGRRPPGDRQPPRSRMTRPTTSSRMPPPPGSTGVRSGSSGRTG